MTHRAPSPPKRNTYPRRLRLSGAAEFLALGRSALRVSADPLQIRGRPNGLDHPRLGLAIARRVGNAVTRNRIKRLLREAFRLGQHDWPAGYDVVISVRPHQPMALAEYRKALSAAIAALHASWRKKA